MSNEKKTALEILQEIRAERNCQDVILGIVQLAMVNREVIHIHSWYAAHFNSFTVRVWPASETYQEDIESKMLLNEEIWLSHARFKDRISPLQRLLEIEDKLLEMIAEAKDKAEAAA